MVQAAEVAEAGLPFTTAAAIAEGLDLSRDMSLDPSPGVGSIVANSQTCGLALAVVLGLVVVAAAPAKAGHLLRWTSLFEKPTP